MGLISILIAVLLIFIASFFIDVDILRTFVEESGAWAPLAFILAKSLTIIIAPLSGGVLYPLAGVLFDFRLGFLYAAIADFLGITIAFWISRLLGPDVVFRITKQEEGGLLTKILEKISTAKGFFVSCIVFIFAPELLAYTAGLSKLRYPTFIVILFPIMIIIPLLLIFIGAKI